MKRIAMIALAVAITGNAVAQQQTWFNISKSIDIRVGSYELRELTGSKTPIATAIERMRNDDGTISFFRVGITLEDCARGYGTLRVYDVGTNAFKWSTSYVDDGDNAAAAIGDALCTLGYETITSETKPPRQQQRRSTGM